MDQPFLAAIDALGAIVGLQAAQFRFVFCLLLCYPLSIIHRQLPTTKGNEIKHIFAAVIGLCQAYICFEADILHFVAATSVTWLLMLLSPKNCGWLAFAFNMLHLTWGNYDRMVNDYLGYSLNWTVPHMIVVCKLSSIAWNHQDGKTAEAVLEKRDRDGFMRAHALKTIPNLLEMFSYIFFFAGFLSGPWSDFTEYKAFVDRSLFEKEGGKIPSPISFLIRQFATIGVALVGYFAADSLSTEWLATPEFATYSLPARIGWYLLMPEIFYFKYYVVWWLGEGATATVGLSYNGRDAQGNVKWDRIRMLNLWRYKLGKSVTKDVVPSWNMMSQHWLRRYVHQRFMTLGVSQLVSRILTFATSAIWHGLYPGYYTFFGLCAFMAEGMSLFWHVHAPFFFNDDGTPRNPAKYVYNFIAPIGITIVFIDGLAPTFQLLAFWKGIYALNQVYWFPAIIFACCTSLYFVVLALFPKHIKRSREIAKKIAELEKLEERAASTPSVPHAKKE